MHDEATARTKWCPMVRIVIGANDSRWQGNAITNRNETLDSHWDCNCYASSCAMWVWDEDEHGVCKQSGTGEPMRGRCGLIRR